MRDRHRLRLRRARSRRCSRRTRTRRPARRATRPAGGVRLRSGESCPRCSVAQVDFGCRHVGRPAEGRLFDATAHDAVDERVDRQREELGAEIGRGLRRAAGDAVGRQHRRGVAEHERLGAIGIVGVASRSRCTSSGAMCIISAVSARFACTSSPSARHLRGHRRIERPPVRDADPQLGMVAGAARRSPTASAPTLPKCAFTNSRRVRPDAAAQRAYSREHGGEQLGRERELARQHRCRARSCSRSATAGSTGAPVRSLAASQSADAIIVSVPVGRCGPCCSVAPTGTSPTSGAPARSASSGHACSAQRRAPAPMRSRRSAAGHDANAKEPHVSCDVSIRWRAPAIARVDAECADTSGCLRPHARVRCCRPMLHVSTQYRYGPARRSELGERRRRPPPSPAARASVGRWL